MSLSVDPKFNVSTSTSTANQFSNILIVFIFFFKLFSGFSLSSWLKIVFSFPPETLFLIFSAIFYQLFNCYSVLPHKKFLVL